MFFAKHIQSIAKTGLAVSWISGSSRLIRRTFVIQATCKEAPDTSKQEFPAPNHSSPQAALLRKIRQRKEFWSNPDNVIYRTPEDKERIKRRSETVVKMLGFEVKDADKFEVKDSVKVGELLASLGHKIPGYPRPKMPPCLFISAAGYEWSSGVDEGVKMIKTGNARELVGLENSGPLNFINISFKEEIEKIGTSEKDEAGSQKGLTN
eukprot:jgi/Galph1/821/GphlegSOOS_G5459.1